MEAGNVAAKDGGVGLLEREREVARLDEFISGVGKPGPRLGLIEGPAGIGKTSLLAEARRIAASDGIRTLTARGSELEREFPYGLVRQLFEPELAGAEKRERAFQGAAAAAATVFEGGDGGHGGFSTLHGLYWLALDLAGENPLAIVVDDLHWADSPSLRFLAYLVRRLEELPIIVVGATRPNEPGADAQLLAELSHDPLSIGLHPGPLSEAAVRELIAARLGREPEPAFLAACAEATGGNPLLLQELLGALSNEGVQPLAAEVRVVHDIGPRAVSRAVLLRLGRLSPEARAVGRAVAILGEGAELWAVADLADLDERAAATATGELRRAEILRPSPPLGFVHPLVRAAIYGDVAPGERELEHAQAARLLGEAGAPSERIASHLLSVGPRGDTWVAETLREAGRESMSRGAADSAAAYFGRALEEPPPPSERSDYVLELGLVQALTDLPAAVPTLREAYAGAGGDPVRKALIANLLGRATLFAGAPSEAQEVARRTAASLPAEHADLRTALLAFESAAAFFGSGRPEAFERLVEWRRPERVETLGEKAMAAVASFDWAHRNGPLEECVALALAALEGGDLIAADGGLLPMYSIATLLFADREEVMDVWEQMLAAAHRSGSLFGISTIHLWHGYTLFRRGDLPGAEELLREAVESFKLYGYGSGVERDAVGADVYLSSLLALVLLERGEAATAREVFSHSEDPGVADSARYWLTTELALLLAEGKNAEALAVADDFSTRLPWNINPTDVHWRSFKAQALDRLDRTDEAIELVREELELARAWGAPATVGRVLRVLGTLERERGVEHLREAVEVLEGSTAKLDLAKALVEHGTALRLERKQTEAREPLRRGLELADICGSPPLVERARTELGAAGARPRTTALSGVESLTPSERRVADLAAEGMSNREIAQELYVTPKTVEVHLSNTYRKLEIGGRRELAGVLAPATP